jgi:hypothetical protein
MGIPPVANYLPSGALNFLFLSNTRVIDEKNALHANCITIKFVPKAVVRLGTKRTAMNRPKSWKRMNLALIIAPASCFNKNLDCVW